MQYDYKYKDPQEAKDRSSRIADLTYLSMSIGVLYQCFGVLETCIYGNTCQVVKR